MSKTSEIVFRIELDEQKLPEKISWKASDSPDEQWSGAKSIMLSIWDHEDANTLRVDLWTKDLRVDEMDQHFFQTLMTMSETYQRATNNSFIVNEMKSFCSRMAQKISEEEEIKRPSQG